VLLLGCTPLLLMAGGVIAAVRAPYFEWAALAVVVATLVRIAVAMRLRRANALPADPLRTFAALFAGELLIVVSTLAALGPPVVEWRGHRYHVGAGGVLRRL
jgi:hypothetical protein